jgi:hypothetical protein
MLAAISMTAILKFGNLAILEATRRASSLVSKFADARRPGSSS